MAQTQPVVAIVEDDVSIQRALTRVLSTAGWQAVPFPSAEAFLQTGLHAGPDCLVLDLWLPGMTGVDLLEHLAATGRDDLQMRMRALQAGAVAYVRKPLEMLELLQTLQAALARRHLHGST